MELKQTFSDGAKAAPAVEVALTGLKSQFADADLRRIAYALLDHISPTIADDDAAPFPRPYPPSGVR